MSKQNFSQSLQGGSDAAWAGKVDSAFRSDQERETDIKYTRRMEGQDRVKKYGIKVGAKFSGQLVGRKKDPQLVYEYEVITVDNEKGVVFLRSKQDEKVRRATFLHKIFGPRKPRGERKNISNE